MARSLKDKTLSGNRFIMLAVGAALGYRFLG
jgi:hypothetical protein